MWLVYNVLTTQLVFVVVQQFLKVKYIIFAKKTFNIFLLINN